MFSKKLKKQTDNNAGKKTNRTKHLAMILSPILRVRVIPKLLSWVQQSRNIRPTIKIGNERFELTVDVHQFNKDEISVKALPEYVIIEGKQERKTKRGYVIRQFVRKFKLPKGCNPHRMESKLSPDGILTVCSPRTVLPENSPCETNVPITYSGPSKSDASVLQIEDGKKSNEKDICDRFFKSGDNKTP